MSQRLRRAKRNRRWGNERTGPGSYRQFYLQYPWYAWRVLDAVDWLQAMVKRWADRRATRINHPA